MTKIKTMVLSLLLVTMFSSLNAEVKWQTDMKEAQKSATAQGKDIFAFFTGSDWCTYCIMLEKEVFKKENFLEDLEKKYVLLKVDFPQRKPLPKPEQIKNDQLSEDYSIQGFPTVLLLDSSGRAFGRTGYKGLGPKEYNEHLNELAMHKSVRDENFAAANKLEGIKKAEALITALKSLGDVPTLHYKGIQEEIFKADPEDKTGYKKNIVLKEKLVGMEEAIVKLIETGKPEEALGMINKFIDEHSPEGEDKQKALLFKIYTYKKDSVNLDEVDKLMDSIIAIDPKTETAENAKGIKQQVAEMRKAEPQK